MLKEPNWLRIVHPNLDSRVQLELVRFSPDHDIEIRRQGDSKNLQFEVLGPDSQVIGPIWWIGSPNTHYLRHTMAAAKLASARLEIRVGAPVSRP